MNSMQGGGRVMQFGKAKARQVSKDEPKVTFADVAGADEAVEELQEIKEFLENPARFQAIGAKIPKGVLLFGPPGTGKTLLARGGGRRGRRAVLLDLGLRLRRDVRRRRRQPRARPVRAGQAGARRRSSSSTRSTPSAATAAPASVAATTSGSRRSTRCSSRWTASTPRSRRDPHRRDQPARHPRPGAAAARSLRPPDRRRPARPRGPRGDPRRSTPRASRSATTSTSTSSPAARRASPAPTSPT